MAELSSENIENHPKSRDNNVTKSMAGGVGGASHSGLKCGEKKSMFWQKLISQILAIWLANIKTNYAMTNQNV